MKSLLLREVQSPIIRSAIINGSLTVVVAVLDVLTAQLQDGEINFSLIVGAASLAFTKWIHSTLTDIANRVEFTLSSEVSVEQP